MTRLEMLAREICWREFSPPRSKKRIGRTKTEYWIGIHAEKKKEYMRDANFLMWCMKNLPDEMLASNYCD